MYWIQRLECGPKRVNHASVAIGDKIYSFGGYCSEEPLLDAIDVYMFNTVSLNWCRILYPETFDCPPGLYGHSVVAYKNNIYLWGGINSLNEGTNKLYCFDLATLSWSRVETTGHLPKSVDGHSACVIENFMYVFGGFESDSEVLVNMLYKLDLEIFKWERVWFKGTPPIERDFHTASAIGKRMYIFGGRSFVDNNTTEEIYSQEIMYFDSTTNTWVKPTIFGEQPRGRRSHSAAVYEGEIYIIGGCSPDYSVELKHLNDVHKFNPERNQWIELSTKGVGPCARRRHCSVVIGDKLYLFGGSSPIAQQTDISGLHYPGTIDVFPPRLKEESDMFILDFCPTLKRLSQLKVIQCGFVVHSLPINLQREIACLQKSYSIMDTIMHTRGSRS